MEREETFEEVIAEMNWAHDANVSTDAVGIASYASRLKAAHDREVATLKAALKPVLCVDVPQVVRLPCIGEPKIIRDLYYAQNAVRDAQRITKEGGVK